MQQQAVGKRSFSRNEGNIHDWFLTSKAKNRDKRNKFYKRNKYNDTD